jgi:hypothetical protein
MVMGPALIFGKLLGQRLAGGPDPLEGDTAEVVRPRK